LSQPLPLSPQFPSLEGRLSVQRDRPADNGERSAQRHNFGRLLDRFSQSDRGQDTARDAVTAPPEQRPRERCSTTDDSPRPDDDAATSDTDTTDAAAMPAAPGHATADPAKPAPDAAPAAGAPTPAPVAVEVRAAVPVVPVAAAAPAAAAPAATEATPVAAPTVSTAAAAVPAAAAAAAATANSQTPTPETPAAAATPKAAAQPAEPVAEPAAPEATADAFAVAPVVVPAAHLRRTVVANGATQPAAKAAAAASAEKAAAEITAPQLGRLPAARAEADASAAANSNQAPTQVRTVKIDANAAAVDATALVAAHEERDAQSSPDQLVANLTSIDSPRRTAALYHKVADAAKAGADTPTPADQISIRLVHAVAEGKRAIQMHLHPAELGSIDVKMQWQGDKLTAQFTVDRPETLQLLQREVPALERSLGQAGVNVDSGSLSFSLRQQQGNGKSGGEGFDQAAANAGPGDGGELAAGEDTLGQVIRDGILSIRV
jgi:flagellar hook-length control protein FliK